MVKIISSYLDKISGSIKNVNFRTNRRQGIVLQKRKPTPAYKRTEAQDSQRKLFKEAIEAWKALSEEEKYCYKQQGEAVGLTGYQYFLSLYLRKELAEALPYWIEECGGNFYIWIKTTIPANTTKELCIKKVEGYYPQPDSVFEFFDDFEGTSLDTSKWTNTEIAGDNKELTGTGVWTIENSILKSDNSNKCYGIVSTATFTPPYTVHAKLRNNPEFLDDDDIGVLFAYTSPTSYYGANICYGDTSWGASTALVADSVDNQEAWGDDTSRTTPKTADWHKIKVEFISEGRAKYYLDDILLSDLDCSILHRDGGVGLYSAYMDNGAEYDYIFITKYIPTPPTISISQQDTNVFNVQITNNTDSKLDSVQIAIPANSIVASKSESLLITEL